MIRPPASPGPAGRLETPLYVYGHSFTTDPGAKNTAGTEWFKHVKNRLNATSVTTYGISGTWLRHFLAYGYGAGPWVSTGTGFPINPPANYKWPADGSRKGVVLLDFFLNDAQNIKDRSGVLGTAYGTAFSARDLKTHEGMLRAALAIFESNARVEDLAATKVGTWTATATATAGGSSVAAGSASDGRWGFTTTPGDTVSFPVTVPAYADHVWVFALGWDPVSTFVASPIRIDVDGVQTVTLTAADMEVTGYDETGAIPRMDHVPIMVRVPVTPGARTIKLTHTGAAGQYLWVDSVLIPAQAPPPVIVIEDPKGFVHPAGYSTAPMLAALHANMDALAAAWKGVVSEFPNAFWCSPTTPTAGLSSEDGIHPNDRGMKHIADDVERAVLNAVARYDPDSLWTRV